MGSVKDVIRDDSLAGRIYEPPKPDRLGLGAWKVSGRFSVGDLKHLIEPVEVPNKDKALAMMAGLYWEHAASVAFQSSYVGMMDADGRITTAQSLLDQGDLSNIVVMRLAVTPHTFAYDGKLTNEARAEYHRRISAGELRAHVGDCECVSRFGLPLGSSYYGKIARVAGLESQYRQVAKRDETVQLLDQIRAIPGVYEDPEMVAVLQDMGLQSIPNPGFVGRYPFLNFDAKFKPIGDDPYTFAEARAALHLDESAWEGLRFYLKESAVDQRDYCQERGVYYIDGKVEVMIVDGYYVLTDFACNPDESRLMIRYCGLPLPDSRDLLVPTNKEIARAVFRDMGVYAAIDLAKERYGDNWRDHLLEFIRLEVIQEATAISVELMGHAIAEVGNRMLRATVFETQPIESWVGPFLPYASLYQSL